MQTGRDIRRRIRLLIGVVIVGLFLSGVTAIPLESELHIANRLLQQPAFQWVPGPFVQWIDRIHGALADTNARYRFMAYGTDWLAFGHFVIAIAFIGPWRDPIKNIWVVEFGLIASILVIPFAIIMGAVRDIPWFWRVIDCSFGIGGLIPLWSCRRLIKELETTAPSPS